ncbi:ATP-binding protein [Streptomyces sp. NPDC047108]|uniref:ATP-binding protein n=1 Tax=Streptomyces sp. NPDC047108 TaxID=3155025 RepID=UPI00341006D5
MTPIPDAPIWLLLPGLAAAGAVALRYRGIAAARAKRIAALEATVQDREQAIRMRDAEAHHLVEHRVPALMKGLWQGRPTETPGLLHDELAGTPFAQAQYTVLEMFSGVPAEASERAESAARAAVKTVTRSMEALLNEQQRAILDMLERHHDEKVLYDANAIDHASSQLSRRTQVIGVLTGSRPLRQRTNSPLEDVVRGGISRIRDYQRVKVTGRPAAAVVSRVVEPVVLAVAELLDNAARHSEPGSDVRVWFVEGHNGVSIVIDDAGVGLKPEDRELAARQLSGREPVLLTQLRNPPKFGFSAVGVLAARYGFRASVEQESDYGGVRAVVYLPKELLTTDLDGQSSSAARTRTAGAGNGAAPADEPPSAARGSAPAEAGAAPAPAVGVPHAESATGTSADEAEARGSDETAEGSGAPARTADTTARTGDDTAAPETGASGGHDPRPDAVREQRPEPGAQEPAAARQSAAEKEPAAGRESGPGAQEPAAEQQPATEPQSGPRAHTPAPVTEPQSGAAAVAPAAADPSFPLRPDGLPQRRRNRPRRPAAPPRPAMQTPSNPAGSVGAVVRGRRRAAQRQQDQNERNPES